MFRTRAAESPEIKTLIRSISEAHGPQLAATLEHAKSALTVKTVDALARSRSC